MQRRVLSPDNTNCAKIENGAVRGPEEVPMVHSTLHKTGEKIMKYILNAQRSALSALLLIASATIITACTDKEKEKSLTEGGMKCGAGKCGASMANGSALLVKKKLNMLNQMKEKDPRRDCVLKAATTKSLYNCVRDPKTGRLRIEPKEETALAVSKSKKSDAKQKSTMKCQAGKCGGM